MTGMRGWLPEQAAVQACSGTDCWHITLAQAD